MSFRITNDNPMALAFAARYHAAEENNQSRWKNIREDGFEASSAHPQERLGRSRPARKLVRADVPLMSVDYALRFEWSRSFYRPAGRTVAWNRTEQLEAERDRKAPVPDVLGSHESLPTKGIPG